MSILSAVLRLGHRPDRDKRMTTHIGLTARAFGLEKMYMPDLDVKIKETIEDVSDRFGGDFEVLEKSDWSSLIKNWKGDTIHLTMYGLEVDRFFDQKDEIVNPLIIVGSKKVPKDVYDIADHNIAIGNQPHSEVGALAVFLDRFNKRKTPRFSEEKISVLPSKRKKRVIKKENIPDLKSCFEFARDQGMDDKLLSHTLSVLDKALQLREQNGGDLDLIAAGAVLHDIGRTVSHDVDHGVEGAELIRKKGWSEEVAKIAERHIGGGITKDEAQDLDIPTKDYVPETLEEKIVCHADNTADGENRFQKQIKRAKEKGYIESVKRMKNLAEEL